MCKPTDNLTDTAALLAAASSADHTRRVKAVTEFIGYRLLANGDLLNLRTGDVYQIVGKSGCTCPDYVGRVAKLRDRMTVAGVATACCCKHRYIRRLLAGLTVKIGTSTFRAKKK